MQDFTLAILIIRWWWWWWLWWRLWWWWCWLLRWRRWWRLFWNDTCHGSYSTSWSPLCNGFDGFDDHDHQVVSPVRLNETTVPYHLIIIIIIPGGEPNKAGREDSSIKGDQHVRSYQLCFCNRFVPCWWWLWCSKQLWSPICPLSS